MRAFSIFQGTLAKPEQLSEIGGYGAYAPPAVFARVRAASTLCFPPTITSKNLFTAYGTHRGVKKFFKKIPLTSPINFHITWAGS